MAAMEIDAGSVTTSAGQQVLQFLPWASTIDVTFWNQLGQRKVDVFQLSDAPQSIMGYFAAGGHPTMPARFCLSAGAFDSQFTAPVGNYVAPGTIVNANTQEGFNGMDKAAAFNSVAATIWEDIKSGAAADNPALLNKCVILTYADLKKFTFTYMIGFPALIPDDPINVEPAVSIDNFLSPAEVGDFKSKMAAWKGNTAYPHTAFLLRHTGSAVELGQLNTWRTFFRDGEEPILVFVDPSGRPGNPGWPLRNLLMLLTSWGVRATTVLCYREIHGKNDISGSIVLRVHLPTVAEGSAKAVGWEKDPKGKIKPRTLDLGALMDPSALADTAVDLNLKLMRWRLLPSLDLPMLASTRCLLLGSGTLGCNVARTLMGWGVRKITMLDYGRVTFSNPVRQSLFQFEDCLNGGRMKAEAAAEHLKQIFPKMDATGINLSIPMPGHAVEGADEIERVRRDVQTLSDLIDQHDVVYLLMDTRESRWLPTLLCAAKNKLVINTALGFDTYLVMRHGAGLEAPGPVRDSNGGRVRAAPSRLGCYYCNDVVAPADSMRDRTLDQQCTVTRPGLSMVASALAVELMVAVRHHPLGIHAAADTSDVTFQMAQPLGLIPHQIRGFLTAFNNALVNGQSYEKCTACSPRVIEEYSTRGFDFLLQVFNNSSYLEDLTGLTKMKNEVDQMADWEPEGEGGSDDGW